VFAAQCGASRSVPLDSVVPNRAAAGLARAVSGLRQPAASSTSQRAVRMKPVNPIKAGASEKAIRLVLREMGSRWGETSESNRGYMPTQADTSTKEEPSPVGAGEGKVIGGVERALGESSADLARGRRTRRFRWRREGRSEGVG
jgi:hypothetical protein